MTFKYLSVTLGTIERFQEGGKRQVNWLDVVLGIFLLIAAVMGLRRGLVSTLIPLIGLIIGVVIAGQYYMGLAHNVFRSHSDAAYIAAFVVIVLIFLIAAFILTRVLHGLLKVVLLDWANHLAGFLLGAILGGLISGAILSLLLKHSIGVSTISDSKVAAFLVEKFPIALSFLPGSFDAVKHFFQ
jgi:membrane protein required for colicin V production